jgi:hypothetical protein
MPKAAALRGEGSGETEFNRLIRSLLLLSPCGMNLHSVYTSRSHGYVFALGSPQLPSASTLRQLITFNFGVRVKRKALSR